MAPEVYEPDHRWLQTCRYGIVNPLQVDEDAWSGLPATPIVPSSFKAQPSLFPLLVDFDELDVDERLNLLDRMQSWDRGSPYPFFSAVLESQAEQHQVIWHLARQMVRRHGSQVDFLRPFDPRVFRHLCWILDTKQQAALLGPVNAWFWREPDKTWRRLRCSTRSAGPRPALAATQWGTYYRIGRINHLVATLGDDFPALKNHAEQARPIDTWLAQAQHAYGLQDTEDQDLFVEQAMRHGGTIHQHPALTERLQAVADGDGTYVEACMDLDEEQLRHMSGDFASPRIEGIDK